MEVHVAQNLAEKKAERLGALGLARQLASIHIVLGHLHNKVSQQLCLVCSTGWLWGQL